LEVPDETIGKYQTFCPKCGHQFNINVKGKYSWEEWKPNQVVPPLMHQKPRTSKPQIAGALLIIVFILGAIMGGLLGFGSGMIDEAIDNVGGTGEFKGVVKDANGSLPNVTVSLVNDPNISDTTDEDGKFSLEVPTGYQKINLSKENYTTLIVRILVLPGMEAIKEKFVMEEGSGNKSIDSESVKIFEEVKDMLPIFSAIFIAFAIIALFGGIFSIHRKYFAIAIVGSIFGILSFGFFIGTILSVAALILILLSKEEFGEKPNEVKF
jgi:hypothetical protein